MKTIYFTALLALTVSFTSNANNTGEIPKTSSKISNWVNKNIEYPESAIENKEEGTVYVAFSFIDGEIQEIEVVGSVSESLDKEVLNTIQTVPVSELGLNTNEMITYILPVKFALK